MVLIGGTVLQRTPFAKSALAMLALIGATLTLSPMAVAQTIGPGNGEYAAPLPGATLKVATYKPRGCSAQVLLVVFHGTDRNAGPYRDHAQPLADQLCAIVISPEFDAGRFPHDLYQHGGVSDHGRIVEPGKRTVDLVAPLVAWAQSAAGRPGLPYILIGHSAGSQFLGRVAAYTTTSAVRIVIANPSTWVMPSTSTAVPYGFGGIKPQESAEQALRAYLAKPVIVELGNLDTGHEHLETSVDAMLQGPYRLARGRNAFTAAKAAAESHGWPFGWTLLEIDGVGHNATKMFSAVPTIAALQAAGFRRP